MNDGLTVEALFETGNQQLSSGQFMLAIESFSQLLLQAPEDWQALSNRAMAYFRIGSYDKSLDDYCVALNLRQDSPNLLANFAVLLKELGQLDLAQNLLQQALQLEPEHAVAEYR